MVPDAEAYRRREIGSKRMEEEAKKIQPLRPLSAADTGDQYPLAAEGGSIRRFDVGGSNSISLDDLNEALRDRAPTIPEQFNRYIAPHIQRGLDAMLPFRQLAQKTFERNVYNPLNESVINNISSAIKTSGTNANDVNDAKIHIANAARKAIGMEPRPVEFDAQKALGNINEGEFDRQYVDMDKRHAQRLEELKKLIAQRKANGGQVDMDRMRLELMNRKSKGGVAHLAIGGQGPRNWVSGSVEQVLHPLKQRTAVGSDPAETLAEMNQKWTPEAIEQVAQTQPNVREMIPRQKTELEHKVHLNKWIQSNLGNYIKKQMATQNDPIRNLAEQGIVHIPSEQVGINRYKAGEHRTTHGGESFGKSEEAKAWEDAADVAITPTSIEKLHKRFQEPWMEKADPSTKLLHASSNMQASSLGFDHLVDVLKEDLASGRIRPEQLNKVSIEQAVRRAHEYDQEKKKAMAETALKATEGMAVHKEYPEGYKWIELAKPKIDVNKPLPEGFRWVEPKSGYERLEGPSILDPQRTRRYLGETKEEALKVAHEKSTIGAEDEKALEEALKYEGNTMGHCVGGYCPDVLEGRTRIFSLRDANNEPHVTIEVRPNQARSKYETDWFTSQPEELQDAITKQALAEHEATKQKRTPEEDRFTWGQALSNAIKSHMGEVPQQIVQIKGKGNKKPKKDYIPFVQDFVKSGNWSDVGDIHNAELHKWGKRYLNKEDIEALTPEEESAFASRNLNKANGGIIRKAEGGAVNPFDYENPEHVSTVAGHVSKHKDFKDLPEAHTRLGEVLSSGSYKHMEDPRVQMGLRKAGHNSYYTQEKTGKKLNKMVINKAVGGAVPSMNQMRAELIGKKPVSLSDLSTIGANEAPSMNVKAYVPPSGGELPVGGVSMGDQPLPIGGIDMSQQQGGQQLMPAGMAPPQGAPQGQPPQAGGMPSPLGAGAPSPQPPSNILQMTKQGQALNAMSPPQAPPRMAVGGSVPAPYKIGGSDNMAPVDNGWKPDNGVTTFNIDNVQQIAKGGSIEKMKQEMKSKGTPCMTHDHGYADGGRAGKKSSKEPKSTVKAYKLFRVHKKHPGKLFPLFVNANDPVEMNKWVDAQEGEMAGSKVKSKIGPLAYRPGWHAGDLPVATHIGEKSDPELTAPDVRPHNHVWAEVEMPNDVDWQTEANERGMNPKGKLIAREAHITDQIPKGGHYRYKTNSNMTGNWLIGGAMKVNRILHDKEVKAINKAAKAKDLPRMQKQNLADYGFKEGGSASPTQKSPDKFRPKVTKASEALGKHEGKHLKVTQSDRTKVGGGFLGGPGFSGLQHLYPSHKDVAWGVNSSGAASKIANANAAHPEGDVLWSTLLGAPNQHTSNQMVFDMLMKQFKSGIKSGKMTPELRDRINAQLAMAADSEGKPIFSNADIASKNFFKNLNTFDQRRVMADLMGGKAVGGKKGQILNYDKTVADTTEPELLGAPTHAIGPRLFQLSGQRSVQPDLNPAFPHMLHGEDLGQMFHPVPRQIMLPEFHGKIKQAKGRDVGFMDLTRNTPSQHLSEEFLTHLQRHGYKKGGKVNLSTNMDTINLELSRRTKKAK